jgi:hypothetical protein
MWLKALVFAGVAGFAQAVLADGNKLLEQCTDAEHFMDTNQIRSAVGIGTCLGLVQGVRNTMQILGAGADKPKGTRVCWPSNGINNGQAVRIVVQFLRSSPAMLHEDEVFLTMLAFARAYPCN